MFECACEEIAMTLGLFILLILSGYYVFGSSRINLHLTSFLILL